ncbi:hypothetical protein ECA1632 [Pectobacterium atrosepticum SCRI1043]|uniref:Uncharacterized protein n=1 Tax=Pectobacterium atrosepticum (strain SCRI 1043 / ATCC BAA-672) TaxID=218491 RepID=Q6D6Q0_PECAS|nr:hypothetical protein [Pectobacterium atrosepticum]MCL6316332.1 hypothetical protein [Pectobacterium atrosepticum]MCL6319432.1 hypothetical protein [Pectobacterium atrosepticum]MCL6392972.1 hypothetical protein [Pectobacterium atrosepticum]CAG74536.1 hypothetical protein ECA1632 [Pectobacterium atrosepticum SCRI1043]
MATQEKPLIYFFNVSDPILEAFNDKKYNIHYKKMNGSRKYRFNRNEDLYLSYNNEVPLNTHEAEIIVIDTESREGFISEGNQVREVGVYYKETPSIVNLTPLDIYEVMRNAYSTNKEQLIIFFVSEYSTCNYQMAFDKTLEPAFKMNSLFVPNYNFNVTGRAGTRISIFQDGFIEKDIKKCLEKYLDDASYNIVINGYNIDKILAINDANESVSLIRETGNKHVILLPKLKNKGQFLVELFEQVLPEHPDFRQLFSQNEIFTWVNDFSYISIEEKNKIKEIENEFKSHSDRVESLKSEYSEIYNRDENVKLRNMLKETGDNLVLSIKWFIEYIGFTNVVNPDQYVNINAGDVFEEDLNFEINGTHFLIEVKGIGGTSTDAQCAQISKIALRRRRMYPSNSYRAIYIVNHQRYKAPKDRVLIPFNDNQIEDAEISQRGMTFTYELFNIYHMIEAGILSKENVREAFQQEGLINFRKSLNKLEFNHCYNKIVVYSLIIPENTPFSVAKNDKIAIQDNENHWHLLIIESIEVDGVSHDEVSYGKMGIKVNRLVSGAKDFYVVKVY